MGESAVDTLSSISGLDSMVPGSGWTLNLYTDTRTSEHNEPYLYVDNRLLYIFKGDLKDYCVDLEER
jgi:hypothetical protein